MSLNCTHNVLRLSSHNQPERDLIRKIFEQQARFMELTKEGRALLGKNPLLLRRYDIHTYLQGHEEIVVIDRQPLVGDIKAYPIKAFKQRNNRIILALPIGYRLTSASLNNKPNTVAFRPVSALVNEYVIDFVPEGNAMLHLEARDIQDMPIYSLFQVIMIDAPDLTITLPQFTTRIQQSTITVKGTQPVKLYIATDTMNFYHLESTVGKDVTFFPPLVPRSDYDRDVPEILYVTALFWNNDCLHEWEFPPISLYPMRTLKKKVFTATRREIQLKAGSKGTFTIPFTHKVETITVKGPTWISVKGTQLTYTAPAVPQTVTVTYTATGQFGELWNGTIKIAVRQSISQQAAMDIHTGVVKPELGVSHPYYPHIPFSLVADAAPMNGTTTIFGMVPNDAQLFLYEGKRKPGIPNGSKKPRIRNGIFQTTFKRNAKTKTVHAILVYKGQEFHLHVSNPALTV